MRILGEEVSGFAVSYIFFEIHRRIQDIKQMIAAIPEECPGENSDLIMSVDLCDVIATKRAMATLGEKKEGG